MKEIPSKGSSCVFFKSFIKGLKKDKVIPNKGIEGRVAR